MALGKCGKRSSQRMMAGERAVRLAAALGRLPDDQAQAVQLRHLDGFPIAAIADKMDKSERGVAGLLFRGLRKLREMLDGDR